MNEEAFEAYLRRELPRAGDALAAELPEGDHAFSPAFEEQMAPLLAAGRRRRRPWRQVLAAAALIAALAAGLSVGAGQRADCQVYWSQREKELSYTIRVEHDSALPFRAFALDAVPEGFTLERETEVEDRSRSVSYQAGEDRWFQVDQERPKRASGLLVGDYQAAEAEIGSRTGLLIREADTGWQMLLWADGPYVLTVTGSGLTEEELLTIAEGIHW